MATAVGVRQRWWRRGCQAMEEAIVCVGIIGEDGCGFDGGRGSLIGAAIA